LLVIINKGEKVTDWKLFWNYVGDQNNNE